MHTEANFPPLFVRRVGEEEKKKKKSSRSKGVKHWELPRASVHAVSRAAHNTDLPPLSLAVQVRTRAKQRTKQAKANTSLPFAWHTALPFALPRLRQREPMSATPHKNKRRGKGMDGPAKGGGASSGKEGGGRSKGVSGEGEGQGVNMWRIWRSIRERRSRSAADRGCRARLPGCRGGLAGWDRKAGRRWRGAPCRSRELGTTGP